MNPTDVALTVGATARLTKLVTSDYLGVWWIQDPAHAAAQRHVDVHGVAPWWDRYRDGLACKWCIGYWVSVGVLASHAVTEGRPRARGVWRFTAATLALNYATATASSWFEYVPGTQPDTQDA